VIPDNARALRITAAAGTELAGASSPGTVSSLAREGSPRATVVYTPKGVLPHAASLRQSSDHCARFPTAASRRSLGRLSVPMWLAILSDQLPVAALVVRYTANELIGREPLSPPARVAPGVCSRRQAPARAYAVLPGRWAGYPPRRGRSLTCYAPVRRWPTEVSPLDLHVLSTPPAFVLSQDQTLQG
jgi:hypothetical protein